MKIYFGVLSALAVFVVGIFSREWLIGLGIAGWLMDAPYELVLILTSFPVYFIALRVC